MSHEYRLWHDFANKRGDYENIPKGKLFAPAFKRFFHFLCCLVIMILLGSLFPVDYVLTDEWANSFILYRSTYLLLAY